VTRSEELTLSAQGRKI